MSESELRPGDPNGPPLLFNGVAPFRLNQRLILAPFPNGGWVILQEGHFPGTPEDKLGAYSSANDMLTALGNALTNATTKGGDA